MQKACLILLITFTYIFSQPFSSSAQVRQIQLDTISTNNETLKLSFFSALEGYIASTGNSTDWVGYTTDSGRTVTKKYINSIVYQGLSVTSQFFNINGLKAFNKDELIVYGLYFLTPAILSSSDGGITYEMVFYSIYNPVSPNIGITDMIFPGNGMTGYAVDEDRILKSVNKGKSWSVIKTDAGSRFGHVEAVNENSLFVFSTDYDANKLIKSVDGGATWQNLILPVINESKLRYCNFFNASMGWISTLDADFVNRVYKTTDGGGTWVLVNDVLESGLYKIKFIDENIGYGLIMQNTVVKTSDGGTVWEPLKRDNNFSYLGYSHNDIQCFSVNQFWAAGNRNFMEITSNGGGVPVPKAFFKIDTIGVANTGIVNLVNKSKSSYSFKWYVNGILISNAYNASYNHIAARTIDTIMLISTNGNISDTLQKYQYFPSPVKIFSFSPTEGVTGSAITITGQNFAGVSKVYFGGVLANSFSILSTTQIRAIVGTGASGAVLVQNDNASGILNGFKYLPPPQNNLSYTVSDTILCKSETATVLIQSSEAGVEYELLDSVNNVYGRVMGNGNTAIITTSPIADSKTFKIKAYRSGYPQTARIFDRKVFIRVEKTRSVFTSSRINILPGETVNFGNQSIDANSFAWKFNQDASINTTNDFLPGNISYGSEGLKSLSLISISNNGCRDTLTGDAVYVYNGSGTNNNCIAEAIREFDTPNFYGSLNPVLLTNDDGLLITGSGNKPFLKSQFGLSKNFKEDAVAFISKFTKNGVLAWTLQINQFGKFSESATDKQGNLYISGSAAALSYLKLVNGDSIRIASSPKDSTSDNEDGFIVKLDSAGNYIWHAVFDDPSPDYQGYPRRGGLPRHIAVKDGHIVIAGNFLANLAYYKNKISTNLVSLKNSIDPNDLRNNFIIKLDTAGNLKWHTYIENQSVNQLSSISGVEIDSLNNIIFSANYESEVIIKDRNSVNTVEFSSPVATSNAYIMKFDSTGRYTWYDDFKSTTINDLTLDEQNNIYITGAGDRSFIKHSSGLTKSEAVGNFYIMKFNPMGINRWITGFVADTTEGSSNFGNGYTILCKKNNLYITGGVWLYNADSISCVLKSLDGNDLAIKFRESEFSIINYDTAGVLQRVIKSGLNNGGGSIIPNKLLIDKTNNFIISGGADCSNNDSSSFIAFHNIIPIRTFGVDGFILKLGPDYCYANSKPLANAGNDRAICSGETISIGSNTEADGDSYYWRSTSREFISTIANPDVAPDTTTSYFLTVINKQGFIQRDTVRVTVTKTPEARAGKDFSICTGNSLAIGTTAATGSNYLWSSDPAGYTATVANPTVSPLVTTTYYLSVSNGSGCVGKDTVTITVKDRYNPSVAIGVSANYVCKTIPITFSANTFDGGSAPTYQWLLNGVNVGGNSNVYITDSLKHNDVVKLKMTSSFSCASPKQVESNEITMFMIDVNKPDITITGNSSVIIGQSSAISTNVQNEGSWPDYLWQDSNSIHAWEYVANSWGASITYAPVENGQKLRCILRSTAECAIPQYDTSNVLTFIVSGVTDINSPISSIVKIYPNPATSQLIIDKLSLLDKWETLVLYSQTGQVFINQHKLIGLTKTILDISLLPPGTYYFKLTRKTGKPLYHKFIKQ